MIGIISSTMEKRYAQIGGVVMTIDLLKPFLIGQILENDGLFYQFTEGPHGLMLLHVPPPLPSVIVTKVGHYSF